MLSISSDAEMVKVSGVHWAVRASVATEESAVANRPLRLIGVMSFFGSIVCHEESASGRSKVIHNINRLDVF